MPRSPKSSTSALSSTSSVRDPVARSLPSSKSVPNQQIRRLKKAENDNAIRAAKAQIRENVREDWTWPFMESEPLRTRFPSIEIQWRERDSDSSLSPSSASQAKELSPSADPYKFDSPDSLLDIKSTRKRKRDHALQEELEYNTGLCTFMRRRDAWTGAMPVPQSPPDSAAEYESSDSVGTGTGSDDSDLSSFSTTSSNFSTTCHAGRAAFVPSQDSPTARSAMQEPGVLSPPVLVPLPPPLLPPTNPIRAAISPATYPSIYSKIVVQGLSPTIPVNLKDVVCAMVDGWKKDGEWPPKDSEGQVYQGKGGAANWNTGTLGDGIGKAIAKRGVGKMKRVLGFEKEGGTGDG